MRGWTLAATAMMAAGVNLAAQACAAESYSIDAVHSAVMFRIKHMNTSWAYGRFNDVSGAVAIDADPAKSSLEVRVKAASVDTANEKRDQHLRGVDLLNATQFPEIVFKSKGMKPTDGGRSYVVDGELTFHGVTRPVSLELEKTGEGKDMQGRAIVGFEGSFSVKRSDFGMKEMLAALGDEVRLTVALEAVQAGR